MAPGRGIEEINTIAGRDRLWRYPFYYAALGEHFRAALTLARNPMESRFLEQRVRAREPLPGADPGVIEPAVGQYLD
jgi:RNA polymerase sigma-70 factor (ECF subfamily)